MSFLNSKYLNCIRDHIEATFITQLVLNRRTYVSDNMGGGTYTTTSSTIYGLVSPYLYGDMEQRNPSTEKTQISAPWTVYTRYDTVVSPKDTITWPGGTLEVISSDHDRSLALQLSILCREVA